MKKELKRYVKQSTFILIGSFFLALGISIFMAPNKISSGGVTSIGTVLLHLFGIRMSVTNFVCNALLFFFGYRYLGKEAIFKTLAGILFLSLFLEITSYIPVYTGDIIISTLAGGILMGIGIGLVIRMEASTGGSDFVALILNRFLPHISTANIIMVIDCIIVIIAGIVFKSFTITFYSGIALFVSSKVSDAIMTMGDSAKTIQVISTKNEEIANMIIERFDRGVTGIYSKGFYSGKEKIMLWCVVSPKELPKITHKIREVDKNAFIVINDAKEVLGEGFKLESAYDKIK